MTTGGKERRVEPAGTPQGERYATNETTNILPFRQPSSVDDALTEISHNAAREMLAAAVINPR